MSTIPLELILTGGTLDAARAHTLGLVNRTVPLGRAREEAVTLAEVIAANAPLAVRESLAIARLALDSEEAVMRTASAAARERIRNSEDYREGARAFVERRTPLWTGR